MTGEEVVSRFQDLIADLVNEGVEPDTITQALVYLGYASTRKPMSVIAFGTLT